MASAGGSFWELVVPASPETSEGLANLLWESGALGCLTLLERSLNGQPAARALDVGTGTGILAIAAAVLGVPTVTALDTDPDAIAAARGNVERNGLGRRIACRLDGPADFLGPPAPLILANLLAHTHAALAPEYRRLSSPGGQLILGGILAEEATSIAQALADHGFALAERIESEGWVSLRLTG